MKKYLLIVLGGILGVFLTLNMPSLADINNEKVALPVKELQRLALVFGMVKKQYVEPVDEKQLINDAIAGLVNGLDPHSSYLDAKEYKDFKESFSGEFVGLGIEITKDDLGIKVVSPIEDSPAAKAGIMTGDVIVQIDEEDVKDLSLIAAVKKMRGEKDTKVKIKVYRKSEDRFFTFNIARQPIKVTSVKSKILQPGYAWVRISNFKEQTIPEFAQHLTQIYQKGQLKGLILDLRNDPGGLLYDAIGIASAFLPKGVLVVSTKGQGKENNQKYYANPQEYTPYLKGHDPLASLSAHLKVVPLVVLINEGSASASEIVAGALKDHKRATLMGSTTFGKGSVQSVQPLPGDTALKITVARYYTPDGISIQAKGIEPTVVLDDFAEGSPYALLRLRESDLSKHLDTQETAQEKEKRLALKVQREELLKQLEQDEKNNKLLKYPELGSAEDFPLQQALNYLQHKPVIKAKVVPEKEKNKAKNSTDSAKETPQSTNSEESSSKDEKK